MKWTEQQLIVRIMDAKDGKLNDQELDELKGQLLLHPEFDDDFFDLPVVHPDLEQTINKSLLFKRPTPSVIAYQKLKGTLDDKLLIGEMEGLLIENEETLIRFKLQEPKFLESKRLYAQTKLVPDSSVFYPNKKELYRESKYRTFALKYLAMAAAASVAILIYFSFLDNNLTKIPSEVKHSNLILRDNKPPLKQILDRKKNRRMSSDLSEIQHPTHTQSIEHKFLIDSTQQILNELNRGESQSMVSETEVLADFSQEVTIAVEQNAENRPISSENPQNRDNIWSFLHRKLKKKIFRRENISTDEQLTRIFEKVSELTSADLAYSKSSANNELSLYIKIGPLVIEHKR